MKMKKSKGWRNEPLRHSLARKGVKTGRTPRVTKVSDTIKSGMWKNWKRQDAIMDAEDNIIIAKRDVLEVKDDIRSTEREYINEEISAHQRDVILAEYYDKLSNAKLDLKLYTSHLKDLKKGKNPKNWWEYRSRD